MFRRTYDIRQDKRFIYLGSKAVDFDRDISLKLVGVQYHMAESTRILGLEYQGKIFPFDIGQLTETDIEYKNVKACEVYLTARPESYYFNDKNNPFFVDKEKLVFDYKTIEEYEEICALVHDALNTIACQYGSSLCSPYYPRFFYNIRCSEIPHNMQSKDHKNRVITGKELLFGSTNNPKDISFASLKLLLDGTELKWASKSKAVQKVEQISKKIIHELGGIEQIREAKKEKEDNARKLLTAYVDEYAHPKRPKEIVEFFKSNNSLTTEQVMAELIGLVAVGADQYHYGAIINLDGTTCITTSPVLKSLRLCYEKELSGIFDNFESFLLKLVLQLESECHIGNNIRMKAEKEGRAREIQKSFEENRAEYNKKNRYKFWKKLL